MAPAGTPRDVVDRLARAVNEALKSEVVRGALAKMGDEPLGGTPTTSPPCRRRAEEMERGATKRPG